MGRIEKMADRFRGVSDREPRAFRAPGRVNLIGEHTDYNDGFVMPFALDRNCVTVAALRDDDTINARALDESESVTFKFSDEPQKQTGGWRDYAEGVIRLLAERHRVDRGIDLVFSSNVPMGGGLSSSAALLTSVGLAYLTLTGVEYEREELALVAQQAEHEFVGMRSGIMDQFTAVFGKKDRAMLLDCRSREIEQKPLNTLKGAKFLVCDSKVQHSLASSEYNQRRAQCELGVKILRRELGNIDALRDVTPEEIENFREELPEIVYRRCKHVVTEDQRVLAAAQALEVGNAERFGELMLASHQSLRFDYQVSCPELDLLVDAAKEIDGVYGARMTGGGFGGCTVNLIRDDVEEVFRKVVADIYRGTFDIEPDIYAFEAADGASEITL
ncbi:MAG: galactokinase [Acidobacteria bacterium]|nr:galactokinase [Acidobacteriota bacterium]